MKKVGAFFAVLFLFFSISTPYLVSKSSYDEEIKKQQELKKQLEEQIIADEAMIESLKKKKDATTSELENIELDLQRVQNLIQLKNHEIERADLEYITLANEMEWLKLSIDEKNNRMKKLLKILYQNYTMSFNAYLFSAKNINEIIDKALYIQYLFEADKAFFKSLKEEKRLLAEKKQDQVEIQVQLQTAKTELDREKARYADLEKQKSTQIAAYAYKMELSEASRIENIRKYDATEAYIKTLLKKKADEERKKKLANTVFGVVRWPINGPVSSPFGMRLHPIFRVNRMHTGIDIDAPSGTPIHSISKGIIIYAGWLSGYGYTVAILHDAYYSSLYAHLRTIYIKEDQEVSSETLIGEVGTTGWSTDPHLHFEIRKDQEPVDPMKFLPH